MRRCFLSIRASTRQLMLPVLLLTLMISAELSAEDKTDLAQVGDGTKATADAEENQLLAGHSYHGEVFNKGPRQAAYAMSGTGRVDFPVNSEHSRVQELINQGVGQLHGFWFFEAERTFRQVAAWDPDCAAAYWGMAMANANNQDRAKKFIAAAIERQDKASPRVKRYIKALNEMLQAEDAKQGTDDYIKALEEIVYEHPDDINAKAFIAVNLWQGIRKDRPLGSHLAADALIQQVLDVEPMHPVHHYRIHLWDREKPERALASAARCGQAAPAIAHMWHMPGHIYSRLHRYADAVWQQEASARTDHAQMMRDQLLPDQIHNFAHNNEWLIRNLIFLGRFSDALDLAKNMIELPRHPNYNTLAKRGGSADYGRSRLLQTLLTGEMWDDLVLYSETAYLNPTDDRMRQVEWHHAVGCAAFHLARIDDLQRACDELEQRLCQTLSDQETAGWEAESDGRKANQEVDAIKQAADKARQEHDNDIQTIRQNIDELDGYLAILSGDGTSGVELLEKAKVDAGQRAMQLLRVGQTDEAVKVATQHVNEQENQTVPLAQLAYIQWQTGDLPSATKTMKRLRKLSASLDLTAAPFSRLSSLAAQLGWTRNWKTSSSAADDVGDRPPLDSLGPFRWQPMKAAEWTLTDATERNWSLADFRGKPVVLIFFLGYGCLHCVEQLQEFSPHAEDFRKTGFELIAISTDDLQGLQQSIEDFDGEIPLPLLADPELDVFRRYRVFDDFENQPLHGTFVIDRAGKIRWFDVSYEPFMDPDFVLKEAKRLIANE